MKCQELPLLGAWSIELQKYGDERGFFARAFCAREFAQLGLEHEFVQVNHSYSRRSGTLRGLHYQGPPHSEVKLVRCVRGRLYDVIVDLRPDSATFGRWHGLELSSENGVSLYVPKAFAHGFITLEADTEVLYQVSEAYSPDHEHGLRWDDPFLAIDWPMEPLSMSEKDKMYCDFDSVRQRTLFQC